MKTQVSPRMDYRRRNQSLAPRDWMPKDQGVQRRPGQRQSRKSQRTGGGERKSRTKEAKDLGSFQDKGVACCLKRS